jgi:hypothetical protein
MELVEAALLSIAPCPSAEMAVYPEGLMETVQLIHEADVRVRPAGVIKPDTRENGEGMVCRIPLKIHDAYFIAKKDLTNATYMDT